MDQSGRTLSGQTLEAFYNSIASLSNNECGINYAVGADLMAPYVEELSRYAREWAFLFIPMRAFLIN